MGNGVYLRILTPCHFWTFEAQMALIVVFYCVKFEEVQAVGARPERTSEELQCAAMLAKAGLLFLILAAGSYELSTAEWSCSPNQ